MTERFYQENEDCIKGVFEGIWLNIEGYDKSSEVLINKWEKLTALSNRRLTVQYLNPSQNNKVVRREISAVWSIDRLTILGNILPPDFPVYNEITGEYIGMRRPFDETLDSLVNGKYFKTASNGWVIRNEYGENLAHISRVPFQDNKARIDFNPSKLAFRESQFMKELIHVMFENPYFSRADLACDVLGADNNLMRSYELVDSLISKQYFGKDGKLETKYFGSASSEKQVRLYDKFREQDRKGQPLPLSINSWWRVEFQLRRGKANDFGTTVPDTLSKFVSPFYIPEELKTNERIMLTGLLHDRGLWSEIAKATKSKYRKLVDRIANHYDEVNQLMLESYFDQIDVMKDELADWLSILEVNDNLDEIEYKGD